MILMKLEGEWRREGAHCHPVLTDRHFSKIYNGMIKAMVALLVGIAICAYVKVSPNGRLY